MHTYALYIVVQEFDRVTTIQRFHCIGSFSHICVEYSTFSYIHMRCTLWCRSLTGQPRRRWVGCLTGSMQCCMTAGAQGPSHWTRSAESGGPPSPTWSRSPWDECMHMYMYMYMHMYLCVSSTTLAYMYMSDHMHSALQLEKER